MWREYFEFHDANPDIYDALVAKTWEIKGRGHEGFGFPMVWEIVRYETEYQTDGGGEYRMNNNFRSAFARAIMAEEEGLARQFPIRYSPLDEVDWQGC